MIMLLHINNEKHRVTNLNVFERVQFEPAFQSYNLQILFKRTHIHENIDKNRRNEKKIKFGYSSYFLFKLTIVTCMNKQINNIIKLNERIIEKKITK